MFTSSFLEVNDSCFHLVMEMLRQNIFAPESQGVHGESAWTQLRSPPLASLLPQIKATAAALVPSAQSSVSVHDLVSGPILDSLCISVFDSILSK